MRSNAYPDSSIGSRALRGLGNVSLKLVLPIAVILCWQLASEAGSFGALFPSPKEIFHALVDWIFSTDGSTQRVSGTWVTSAVDTLSRVAIGYLLAAVCGVIVGILCSWWKITRRVIEPTIQTLRFIPPVSWIPLSIIWFGIGNPPAIFIVFLAAFFPIFIATAHGITSVPSRLIQATEMMSANSLQRLLYVAFPSAIPTIYTGLRTALGTCMMTVVTAEMIAVPSGLGYSLWDSYNFMRLDIVVAAMLSIGLIGLVLDFLIHLLFRRVIYWKDI